MTHILLDTHRAVMHFSLPVEPWSGIARTSHPGAVRPYPCMPDATTISVGSPPRRHGHPEPPPSPIAMAGLEPRADLGNFAHARQKQCLAMQRPRAD